VFRTTEKEMAAAAIKGTVLVRLYPSCLKNMALMFNMQTLNNKILLSKICAL
jgi:hypothetical protein